MKNPPRTERQVHAMLGRWHPNLVARFADLYESTPVPPNRDPPTVLFRGVVCVRCGASLGTEGQGLGVCAQHRPDATIIE